MKLVLFALTLAVTLRPQAVLAAPPPGSAMASDAEIKKILAVRIDVQHQATGAVVGVVSPRGRQIVSYGTISAVDRRPMTGDTVFDVGSITKVFTALLLSEMTERGEVKLDDPAARYLPGDRVCLPERGGKQITLVDLATHTSGLPLRPGNLASNDPNNKYAGYTVDLLYQFLSLFTLTRDIGIQYEYSNVGYGLLASLDFHGLEFA
jgi:CubicO group peptidase (beta-lactamase class C family)